MRDFLAWIIDQSEAGVRVLQNGVNMAIQVTELRVAAMQLLLGDTSTEYE